MKKYFFGKKSCQEIFCLFFKGRVVTRKEEIDCDYWHYKERHAVECMFGRLKHYRRITTRYEKRLLITWGAVVFIGAFMVEMKRQQNLEFNSLALSLWMFAQ